MNGNTLFITYNPNVAEEQTLAIRLHSIGAVNGFRMYLPDRFNSEKILDENTKTRIDAADYVILFAISPVLSPIVKQEIEYAFQRLQDKSKIIVIYSTQKNLKGDMTNHFTEIYYNIQKETPDQVIARILNVIFKKQQEDWLLAWQEAELQKQKAQIKRLQEEKERQNALIALLGVGLGLAMLAAIAKD